MLQVGSVVELQVAAQNEALEEQMQDRRNGIPYSRYDFKI